MIGFILMLTVGAIMMAIGGIFGLSGPDAAMAGLVVFFVGLVVFASAFLVRLFRSIKRYEHQLQSAKATKWHQLY